MKKVIITGATGMIGRLILQDCLNSSKISTIISFVRKETGMSHSKLKEVIISDFNDYSAHQDYFKHVSTVFFCIGVYTSQVSDTIFKQVTVDYLKSFVDTLKAYSPEANFCFLSGQGADRTEKSKIPFARYKGIAENYLFNTLDHAYTIRPAYIYPVQKRKEPNLAYRIFRVLYPITKLFGKKFSIPSTTLASAMFRVGLDGAEKKELDNKDLLAIRLN